MSIFKKATGKLFTHSDLDIVVDYIKASLKSELDSVRIRQNKGIIVDLGSDWLLQETSLLVDSIINNIDTIKKRTDRQKKVAVDAKGAGCILSPDENYIIEMAAIKDIKREGLNRPLTSEERNKLREATKRFNIVYSEQIKSFKGKEKYKHR